jgi:hypothetical protein
MFLDLTREEGLGPVPPVQPSRKGTDILVQANTEHWMFFKQLRLESHSLKLLKLSESIYLQVIQINFFFILFLNQIKSIFIIIDSLGISYSQSLQIVPTPPDA